MIHIVRAIVRHSIPGAFQLRPGMAVLVNRAAFEQGFGLRFPVTPEASPNLLFLVSPEHLLPYEKFLKRRPVREYWTLGMNSRLTILSEPNQFLEDPHTERFGPKAFRFESMGEVIRYLWDHDLTPSKFSVSHTTAIKLDYTSG